MMNGPVVKMIEGSVVRGKGRGGGMVLLSIAATMVVNLRNSTLLSAVQIEPMIVTIKLMGHDCLVILPEKEGVGGRSAKTSYEMHYSASSL